MSESAPPNAGKSLKRKIPSIPLGRAERDKVDKKRESEKATYILTLNAQVYASMVARKIHLVLTEKQWASQTLSQAAFWNDRDLISVLCKTPN